MRGIIAKLNTKPDCNPQFLNAQPVLYSLWPKVEKELDYLMETGVPVRVSNRATPIVSVLKNNVQS